MGRVITLGTLPEAYGHISTKEHVEKVLYFVSDFKSKPHSDHDVPSWAKLLIHSVFDHLSSSLQSNHVRAYTVIFSGLQKVGMLMNNIHLHNGQSHYNIILFNVLTEQIYYRNLQ